MAQDFTKQLDRARRYLERNKLQDAVAEYQKVLDVEPLQPEAVQALADLHVRLNDPARAAYFYGLQFDRLVEAGDSNKAAALYGRFLKSVPQPPERMARYGVLLQRQNKAAEAIEQYAAAEDLFREQGKPEEALTCGDKIAQLDPDNAARHIALAELAESFGKRDVAVRGYLRAGQLALAGGDLDRALELFGKAHHQAPRDRSGALLYADARLRHGDAAGAVALLEPFAPDEADSSFLVLYGEALLRAGQLDRARSTFQVLYRQKPDSFEKLFDVAGGYLRIDQDEKAVQVLSETKEWMFAMRRENEFATRVDQLAEAHPSSMPLATFWACLYEELNREAKYFDALVRIFDIKLAVGNIPEACETLERLVDIDPYDFRNHERIQKLEGRVDPAFLSGLQARAAKAATFISPRGDLTPEEVASAGREKGEAEGAGAPAPSSEEARARQALDDLVVQVEIFLQYSLQAKAVERLERIAEMFPGEEETNERLRAVYDRANWWPKGAPPPPRPKPAAAPAPAAAGYGPDTHRDLAAIAEITRQMYRQATPREVVASAVNEIGKYLGVKRCLAAVGAPGAMPQLAAEYFASGFSAAGGSRSAATMAQLARSPADPLGGIELQFATAPILRELGLATALGVQLTDKETQAPAGILLVGDAAARTWKPNESFFLQAVGDQIVLAVNHTRLRSLVRNLAVADEKTGLLNRGAYLDCLLAEANRARTQGTPLALVILQMDRGPELLRQQGDAALERHLEQVTRALEGSVRQSDLAVKYTAWSLAFILPDTRLENASALAEKLRRAAGAVRPPWAAKPLTLSAVVAEVSGQPGDESEDVVTDWINRAEFGLDEARQRGGNTVVSLEPVHSS